jgi:hypothetical protein
MIASVILGANTAFAQSLGESTRDQGAAEDDDTAWEEEEPPSRWRGTSLKWGQSATTTALGVGNDNQSSSSETYTHGYWALLNYYLLQDDSGSLRLNSSPGLDVELTNSNTTTLLREPQLRDLNLTASGRIVLWDDRASKQLLDLWPSMTVLLPTSEVSRKTGMYFTTSPRVSLTHTTAFLRDVDFPNAFVMGVAARWDHRFTQATEPVSTAVAERVVRPDTDYNIRPADNLTGSPEAHDAVTGQALFYLAGELFAQPIFFSVAAGYTRQFLFTFSSDCVDVGDGTCLDVVDNDDVLPGGTGSTRDSSLFSVSLEYWMFPELSWSIGYANSSAQPGPDGLNRSPFYSPAATFTTQIVIGIDAIYEGLAGPRRKTAFFLPG